MITPKSRSQLAHLYAYTCTRTFTRHLKKLGIQLQKNTALHVNAQLRIYAIMGIPAFLNEDEKKLILPLLEEYCKL
ncbi:MAG: hypothetical protein AAFP82_03060, partial [Bacteroidota bacterium]